MFRSRLAFAGITVVALAGAGVRPALAQARKLRVISSDSQPIVYAYVTTDGGTGQITDEGGTVSLGAGKAKAVSVSVRRIGYQQWFGKLDLPDTAATLTVVMPRIAQTLGAVQVTGSRGSVSISVPMKGFYDRWLMRQKGVLSAQFIGPEEIEFRHPNRITNMLYGLNGVSLLRNDKGDLAAMGYNGQCQMAVLLDGVRQCPGMGCKCDECGGNGTGIKQGLMKPIIDDMHAVIIDHIVDPGSVAAIEVYPRGGNMPSSLPVSDAGCGVIAIWTGSRRP